ncbi:PREDICTED: RH-like protein [Merops nubicus]|uniref:RH-like protein n=1 Tax=Merops nubicus TaxID=57421 RepID=UPI0004F07110|nr:PREDICTED: RH-like protein [Merops nubicus]
MASEYRSFRHSLPWLILSLQVVLIILFYFTFPGQRVSISSVTYPVFQDVHHMVIFGFGFFLMFLRRYGFSSAGFNLLMVVLGVQLSVLIEGLLAFILNEEHDMELRSITKGVLSMTAVVISTGAVLGKMNPVQLTLMTVAEIMLFHVNRWINQRFLLLPENVNMMHVHLFGAYFGLAVSSRFPVPSPRSDKNASTPKSVLLSMLGTLFLWVFWPSFNSVLAELDKSRAICNTYFALAVSAVTAFVLSVLTTKDGKFKMAHIQSAVLAGGVAVGYTAHSIEHPWIAMILGLLASVITILGSHCLQGCLYPVLKIHDTSGVHSTFGLPGVLGALAQVILLVIQNWTTPPSLPELVLEYVGAFCLTINVALLTGLITGFILNLKLFKTIPVTKYFEDQFYWEFPHLAVGF